MGSFYANWTHALRYSGICKPCTPHRTNCADSVIPGKSAYPVHYGVIFLHRASMQVVRPGADPVLLRGDIAALPPSPLVIHCSAANCNAVRCVWLAGQRCYLSHNFERQQEFVAGISEMVVDATAAQACETVVEYLHTNAGSRLHATQELLHENPRSILHNTQALNHTKGNVRPCP